VDPERCAPAAQPRCRPRWRLVSAKDLVERFDDGALPSAAPNPATGLLEVDCVGCGFLLARRAVFERFEAAYPERRIVEAHGMYEGASGQLSLVDYFPLGSVAADGVFAAEDINFCRMYRTAGGRVWVDTTSRLGHVAEVVQVGDPQSQIMPPGHAAEAA
jgi:hypothetical protein